MKHVSVRAVKLPEPDSTIHDDDDVMVRALDPETPLVDLQTAEVRCTKVEGPIHYGGWQGPATGPRLGFVLHFHMIEPPYERLRMFVRYSPNWRYLPRRSKLFRSVQVALNGQRRGKSVIQKSWFVGHIFRARLRTTTGRDPYTVVDELLELRVLS